MLGLYKVYDEFKDLEISENVKKSGVVYCYDDLWRATFSPYHECLILHRIPGKYKTYQDKKEYIRSTAIEYKGNYSDIPLSWFDVSMINEWFNRYGKRYGLTKEFKENGII